MLLMRFLSDVEIKFLEWIYIISLLFMPIEHHLANAVHIKECDYPLGMESGGIPDSAITASSSYVPIVGPTNGRLRVEKAGGAWCPKQLIEHDVREYLQVDLGSVHIITGVETQGRFGNGRGQEYAEEYTIEYWRPSTDSWRKYRKWDGKDIMPGNRDTSTVVTHTLMPPVYASKLRILPHSLHLRTICIRLELRGCTLQNGIISYQIPEDKIWKENEQLSDLSYDGTKENGYLINGLGRLVDGILGGDNFKIDLSYGKGNGWVGWHNDSFPSSFIELIFEFDEIRNFSSVHLFANNGFRNGVQVFSKARISFSVGGKYFNSQSVIYTYMPDTVLENARNVTIHLNHNVGKFVKIRLYFANNWIMLSEVHFDSEIETNAFLEEAKLEPKSEEVYVVSGGVIDPPWDPPQTISAHKKRTAGDYVEVVIGVLTALILLLLGVFLIIVVLNHRHKLENSPTAILKNPFSVRSLKSKDVFMNISPTANIVVNPTEIYEDRRLKNELGSVFEHQTTTQIDDNDNCMTKYYDVPNTLLKPAGETVRLGVHCPVLLYSSVLLVEDLVLLENQTQDRLKLYKRENSCYEVPTEYTMGEDSEDGNEDMLDDSDVHQPDQESLRLKKEKPTYPPAALYRSLRKTVPDPQSFSPPSSATNEMLIQYDKSSVYDTAGLSSETLTSRKRYHTSPHDKNRQTIPMVSWNIAPTPHMPYKCREADIVPLPRYFFKVCSKLGSCHLGEVILCETTNSVEFNCSGRIAAKTCKGDMMREIRLLTALQDQNLARIFGVCTAEQPPWLITEYPAEYGDVLFFLQSRSNVKYSTLIWMCLQVASAMKYLESKNLVHKDLAARNCLVSRNFVVKVADIAICNNAYRKHYADLGDNRPAVPVRWLPWESILLERYSSSSSVWSFGVTMWEILNLARDIPYPHLTDEQVIQNAENSYYGGQLQIAMLPKPAVCVTEIYDLLCECWERDYNQRPSFKKVYSFLKRNNSAYTADFDRQLYPKL